MLFTGGVTVLPYTE